MLDAEQSLQRPAFRFWPVGAAAPQMAKRRALFQRQIDHDPKLRLSASPEHRHQSLAEWAFAVGGDPRNRGVEGFGPEQGRLAPVEHAEIRGDPRLERKPLQNTLAEAVDGINLEAAFSLKGPRNRRLDDRSSLVGRAPVSASIRS